MPLRTKNSWPPPRVEMNWVLKVSPSVTSEGFSHSRFVTHEFGKMPKTLSRETFRKAFRPLAQKVPAREILLLHMVNTRICHQRSPDVPLRRRRALREVPQPIDSSGDERNLAWQPPDLADASPDPETTYLRKEEAGIVSAAIRHLRPGMRRAVELRELGDLSTQETARRMGLSVAAIKARVFHARKELGKALRCHAVSLEGRS